MSSPTSPGDRPMAFGTAKLWSPPGIEATVTCASPAGIAAGPPKLSRLPAITRVGTRA